MHSSTALPDAAPPGGDAGWGISLRHDLDATATEVWRRLLADWLPLWLDVDSVPQMVGAPLRREGRVRGRVVGCHMGRRVRVRWAPPQLAEETIVQVTLEETADGTRRGTTLVLQQDQVRDLAAQQTLLARWQDALAQLPG